MKTKVLLVEDDANLAFMLTDGLEAEGFEVQHVDEGEKVLQTMTRFCPCIILLDVNLKGVMNGFETGAKIRQTAQLPIIFITSRTQAEDLQTGFQLGNVDYLKKPFGMRELVLRINELLQRNERKTICDEVSRIGNYLFSASEQSLQLETEKIHLPKNECAVLNMLFKNRGRVLSKKEILETVWNEPDLKSKEPSLNNILFSLRSKLSNDSAISIETIPKVGWKLTIR
ncbi:two component transcriptional regulator, winged helix family [Paludibacter propionicigenes WB4]|uniref:Two component transcriptional regulator, winged helix family n=1 Tax=Paludibacter propionicigenes (strain DSM 17365 / JCM 13257 / WB4) TaxID=694427 RepID=E4T844_PALPW|nr:response regulator transcription factor [Paludibacter propionicigenes]ADQ80888.1 two component transcriptional regulator, winged helix family [Paludibacter propionicigenes WB4]